MKKNIIPPKEIKIDDLQFYIHSFPALEALKLQSILLQKVGPALGQLLGKVKTDNILDTDLNGEDLSKALQLLFSSLDEEIFISLVLRILKNTIAIIPNEPEIVLNAEENINRVFQRNLIAIYKVIFEILKFNYSDFFVLMGDIGTKMKGIFT